jgi:small-conductance mechanosensitive channel
MRHALMLAANYRKFALILLGVVLVILWFTQASPGLAGDPAQAGTPTPLATPQPEQIPTPLPGAPVVVGNQVIGYVYARVGSLTASERAALLNDRLANLVSNPFAPQIEFEVVESEFGTDILANGEILLTVTDQDAETMNTDRQEYAVFVVEVLKAEIERVKAQNAPAARLMRGLQTLVSVLVVVVLVFIVNLVYRRLKQRVETVPEGVRQKGFFRSTNYYRTGAWKRVATALLSLARYAVDLVILVLVLPYVLKLFPATASLAVRMVELFLAPLSGLWNFFIGNRSNFVTIGIIAVVVYLLIRFEQWFFNELATGGIKIKGFEKEWARFTGRLVSFLLIVMGVVVAYPYVPGSDSDAFKGVTIFLGALVTISSASAVTNIVSGIIQTYTGSFRNGDVIRIGEVTGIVVEKRLLTTRVRTFKNEDVSIPNSSVLNSNVTNYSNLGKQGKLVLYTTITIGYDAPWVKVHELLLAAAGAVPDISKDPAPFVLQTSLNDFHVSYQLNCYTRKPERMPRIYSELHASIQDQFNQAGVEIMSPAFAALRDGNTVTIPPENLPQDYQAPGFRVNP